eukprot:1680269-Alexandrium_andersonii.AAC.1
MGCPAMFKGSRPSAPTRPWPSRCPRPPCQRSPRSDAGRASDSQSSGRFSPARPPGSGRARP